MNISEIRKKYPQYSDLSDDDLARGLHGKFYADMPFEEFSAKIGFTPQKPEPGIVDRAIGGLKALVSSAQQTGPPPVQIPNILSASHTVAPTIPALQPATAPIPTLEPGTMEGFRTNLQRLGMLGQPTPQQALKELAGAGEAIASFATAPVGIAGAGLAGLGATVAGKPLPEIAAAAQEAIQGLTLQPQSPEGRQAAGLIGYPFEKLSESGDALTKYVYEKTESPFFAALIGSLPELAPALLPFMGRRPRTSTGLQLLQEGQTEWARGKSVAEVLRDIARDPKKGVNSPEWEAALNKYVRGEELKPQAPPPEASPAAPEPVPPKSQFAQDQFNQRFMREAPPEPAGGAIVTPPPEAPPMPKAPAVAPPMQPKTGIARTDLIRSAAYRMPDGTVYEGATHPTILNDLQDKNIIPENEAPYDFIVRSKAKSGFVTSDGKFVSRSEADKLIGANESRRIAGNDEGFSKEVTQPVEAPEAAAAPEPVREPLTPKSEFAKTQFEERFMQEAPPEGAKNAGTLRRDQAVVDEAGIQRGTGEGIGGQNIQRDQAPRGGEIAPRTETAQEVAQRIGPAEMRPPVMPAPATAAQPSTDIPPWQSRGQEKASNPPMDAPEDSPEVQQWNEDKEYLIQKLIQGKPNKAIDGLQEVVITIGATGSGKSTGLRAVTDQKKIIKDETVFADSDIIKKEAGHGAGDDVGKFHERSSQANKEARTRAINAGLNTVYDSLGKNFEDIKSVIDLAVENNRAHVTAVVMDVEAETSIARALQRRMLYDLKTGKPLQDRKIDFDVNIDGYNRSLPTFKQILVEGRLNDPNFDFYVYDNNADGSEAPKLVLQQENGIVTIGDLRLFDKWLRMGYSKIEKGGETRYVRSDPARREQIERNFAAIYQRARRGAERAAAKRTNVGVRDLPEYRELIEQSESYLRRESRERLEQGSDARERVKPLADEIPDTTAPILTKPKNPPADLLKKTAENEAAKAPSSEVTTAGKFKQIGHTQKLVVPNKRESVPVRFAVMETAEGIPSHDPMTFAKNKAFPQGVQERLYHSSREEQAKVIVSDKTLKTNLILNTNPDAMNGPPIVTPDGVVLAGTSRWMRVARAYLLNKQFGKGEKYKGNLARFAGQFGLDGEAIRGMDRPQLVRVFDPPDNSPATLRRLASDFNKSPAQGMSQEAATASMGKNVSPKIVEFIGDALSASDKTLREYLDAKGIQLLDRLIDDGVIPATDRGRYYSAKYNKLNESGKDVIEQVLVGSVIDDADILTSANKSDLNKIVRALQDIVKVRARGDAWDITPQLKQALDVVTLAKSTGANKTLTQYYAQQELPGAGEKNRDPAVMAIAEAIWSDKPTQFSGRWSSFAKDAAADTKGQTFMFAPKSPQDAFREAFGGELKPARSKAGTPADRIKTAYDSLKSERGISNIEIADIRDKAGVSQAEIEAFLKGNQDAVLADGDYSVADDHTRSGAVKVDWTDRPQLLAKIETVAEKAPPKKPKGKGKTLYSGIPIPEVTRFMGQLGDIYTRKVGSPLWDTFIINKLPKLLEKLPGGSAVNRAFIYDYRGDLPMTDRYMESMEDMQRGQAAGREYAIDIGKRLQAMPEESQIRMGEAIRGELDLEKLSPDEGRLAMEAVRAMTELGRQAVDAGLLSEETYFKNVGRYMPRLYTSKEYQGLLTKYGLTKPNQLDLSRFKKRQDIPKEIREEMGEILTPGYPVAKGIVQMTHDIEMAKFFNGIADTEEWAWTRKLPKEYYEEVKKDLLEARRQNAADEVPLEDIVALVQKAHPEALIDIREDAIGRQRVVIENGLPIPDGFKQLPKNPRLGRLSEAYVHPEIFNDLQDAVRIMGEGEKLLRKGLASWKFGKVIASPKTHIRNMLSNSVLAHLGGMPMYEQPVYLWRAASELKNQGELWKEAKREGVLKDTFVQAELRQMFDALPELGRAGGPKDMPAVIGKMQAVFDAGKKVTGKMAEFYELEEQWFKLAKFIHSKERAGMSSKEAAADAQKWLFDYSKVTRFQNKYRQSLFGAPFATFTFKALPRIAEAAVKYPWRFALPGAIILGIEEAARRYIGDTEDERKAKEKLRPDYMQTRDLFGIPNYVRWPFVDEHGREHYLNLTYILPWGDLAEGGDFAGIPGGLRPMSHPLTNELAQQIMNWDAFRKENIVKEEDTAGMSKARGLAEEVRIRGKHAFNTFAPTMVADVVKGLEALKREPDYRGRVRAPGVVAADALAGFKLYPVDYDEQMQRAIARLDPDKGRIAKQLQIKIKTLATQKQAAEKRGGEPGIWDKKINERIDQLKGLVPELKEYLDAYKKIPRRKAAGA